MNILLFDNGTKYLSELVELLKKFGKVVITNEAKNLSSENADLTVLSGGHNVYINEHPEAYQTEIEFIKNNQKPILGICLGAELIAYTFGGELKLLGHNENNLIKIDVLEKNHIFEGVSDFEVYENHKLTISALSPDLIGLAKSETGYEVIKHVAKPIYGFQFHPEMFKDKTCGDEIFKNLLGSLSK